MQKKDKKPKSKSTLAPAATPRTGSGKSKQKTVESLPSLTGRFLRQLDLNRKSYREFLKDQRVVLVGPAPSVIDSNQGALIDSFPVVVRLNKGLNIPEHLKKDVGTRTDILYNCMHPSPECGGDLKPEQLVHQVKYLVSPYPYWPEMVAKYRFPRDIAKFVQLNRNRVKFCCFDTEHFRKLEPKMQLPNTGLAAILDLLSLPIKELYITGITFFRGGYYQEYRPYNEKQVLARMAQWGVHDQVRQLRYSKQKLKSDKRVRMDPALHKIVHEPDPPKKKASGKGKSNGGNKKPKKKTPEPEKKVQVMRLPDRFILPLKLSR